MSGPEQRPQPDYKKSHFKEFEDTSGLEYKDIKDQGKDLMKEYKNTFPDRHERKLVELKLGGANKEGLDAMAYLKNNEDLGSLYHTLLKPDSYLPSEDLQKLIAELKENDQDELHEKEFVLTGEELTELQALIENDTEEGNKIDTFLQKQKEQHLSADEVFGSMSSGTEKLLAQVLSDSGHASVDTFPQELVNEQPEAAQSMRWGTLSWLHEKLGAVTNKHTKKEEYNTLLHEKVLTDDYQENREALKEWSEALYRDSEKGPEFFEKSPTFRNPVKYKTLVDNVMTGKVDISKITPGDINFDKDEFNKHIETFEEESREKDIEQELVGINDDGELQEKIGKPIQELMDNYQDAEKMTKGEKMSKKFDSILTGVGELSERIETTVQENFETFEKLFALPVVGPMLKSWFVSDEAEKPGGWYYEARQEFIEEKGKLSGTEKRLLTTLVGDDKEERRIEDDATPQRETDNWYKRQEVPKETGSAIGAFDLDQFAEKMTDQGSLNDFSDSNINEGDRLHGVDFQEHMLRGMYSKLYSSEEVEGKIQEYAKLSNLSENTTFNADLETYASNRVRGLLEDHQTTFDHPQDIANILFVDLIKGADDYALEYHAKNYQGEETAEKNEKKDSSDQTEVKNEAKEGEKED